MNRFIKIFRDRSAKAIENDINEMVRKRNLNIVSTSICNSNGVLVITVVFEKQNNSECVEKEIV